MTTVSIPVLCSGTVHRLSFDEKGVTYTEHDWVDQTLSDLGVPTPPCLQIHDAIGNILSHEGRYRATQFEISSRMTGFTKVIHNMLSNDLDNEEGMIESIPIYVAVAIAAEVTRRILEDHRESLQLTGDIEGLINLLGEHIYPVLASPYNTPKMRDVEFHDALYTKYESKRKQIVKWVERETYEDTVKRQESARLTDILLSGVVGLFDCVNEESTSFGVSNAVSAPLRHLMEYTGQNRLHPIISREYLNKTIIESINSVTDAIIDGVKGENR